MQASILDLGKNLEPVLLPREVFTFRPFVAYVRQLREKAGVYRKEILSSVIERFEQSVLSGDVDPAQIKSYEELLDIVYATLVPAATDEGDKLHALALPVSPVVFYSSDRFHELVTAGTHVKKASQFRNSKEMERMRLEFCYMLVMEKCYGFTCPFHIDMTYVTEDTQSGLDRAFRLSFDTRFIEVVPENGTLPVLDPLAFEAASNDKDALVQLLHTTIPLDLFRFEGFKLMTVEEVTAQFAIDEIRNHLLEHDGNEVGVVSEKVEASLKMLLGASDVELGLLPVYQVNNKFISNDPTHGNGCTPGNTLTDEMAEKLNAFLTDVYIKKPKRIFFREISEADASKHFYLKILRDNGVKSYALIPVFYNETLTGILEIYTHKEDALNLLMLSRLESAMPFLSQLLQRNIDTFNNRIETIIKENFTSIQPSVQWKFNEAAWHYLRDQGKDKRTAEIENIDFEKVYPLYGAVDIRNSTVERNDAMLKDLRLQFGLLIDTLEELKNRSGFSLLDAKLYAARQWHDQIHASNGFYQQTELNDFLENDIHPFLEYFSKGNPEFTNLIMRYLAALDAATGSATGHMRQLEISMNAVISVINTQVEEMSRKAQQAFPCFFEKFRTDGVEYDIYLGQSITPNKIFSDIYLKNMRLLQLRSMAVTARQTHALYPTLPTPVETTQLIFIHSHPIDIKFRKDERRFDVEGAYNIRYQVVKKRIDKVHIKGTSERLTAPNKIALTYFNQKEAEEYIAYIHFLQQEGLLTEEIEFLELEPLQGVVGMRALRVGVRLD